MIELRHIGERLTLYLGAPVQHLGVLASGWETTIFEFSLAAPAPAPEPIPAGVPMVLRFYEGGNSEEKGAREFQTMAALAAAGYAVPRPYRFDASPAALGAPFLVMARVAGGPLFGVRSFPRAFKTFSLAFFDFVRQQARLHRLDHRALGAGRTPRAFGAAGTPAEAPLLDRALALINERIESGPLPGLREAFTALQSRAARFREARPSLLHMDYHPQNVLVRGVRVTGVIDWVLADVGDRHLDAAMTSVILASSAMEHPRWMRENAVGNSLRWLFASLYTPLYHALAPMDFERFRYCQAVAALLRLSMLGMMRARGAEFVGFRPEALSQVTPSVLRILARYAARKSGAMIAPDFALPLPA